MLKNDYSIITEKPGIKGSKEQLERMQQRYNFALPYCQGKTVLEIGCGTGQGLGLMARGAHEVGGIDIDPLNIQQVKETYQGNIKVWGMTRDGMKTGFGPESFDTVVCYETLYYLPSFNDFLLECHRILKPGGTMVVCSVNCEWPDFNPSPFHIRYYTAKEIKAYMLMRFNNIEMYGGFDTSNTSTIGKCVSLVKRTAVNLHIVPKSMKGKEILKRIFFGKLVELPRELDNCACQMPVPVNGQCSSYKIIYAVGVK